MRIVEATAWVECDAESGGYLVPLVATMRGGCVEDIRAHGAPFHDETGEPPPPEKVERVKELAIDGAYRADLEWEDQCDPWDD